MAADDGAVRLRTDVGAASEHLGHDVEAEHVARPADEVDGDDGGAAHRVDVAERVRGRDATEVVRVVDDRGEEVSRREHRLLADAHGGCVVTVVEADDDTRIRLPHEVLHRLLELAGRDLARAPATMGVLRQTNRFHASDPTPYP